MAQIEQRFPGENDDSWERKETLNIEKDRVEKILETWLPRDAAQAFSEGLLRDAEELDFIARKINSDPAIRTKYDYDGNAFTAKDKTEFEVFVSRDGLAFLRSLDSMNLSPFDQDKNWNVKAAQDWIEEAFLFAPRARLKNLEESGNIGIIDKEAFLDALKESDDKKKRAAARIEADRPDDSAAAFLEPYEKEMEEWQKKQNS